MEHDRCLWSVYLVSPVTRLDEECVVGTNPRAVLMWNRVILYFIDHDNRGKISMVHQYEWVREEGKEQSIERMGSAGESP